MKNFLKISVLFIFCATQVLAQNIATIVKQDGRQVYLDISELQNKPSVGNSFSISFLGEEIVNPKTGKSLGKEVTKKVSGYIKTVEELYSVGELDEETEVLGMDAKINILQDVSTTHTAFTDTKNRQGNSQDKIMPLWESSAVEGSVSAVSTGDVDGDGQTELILAFSENNEVKIYKYASPKLREENVLKISNLRQIISMDSADLDKNGRAEIFISVYDSSAERFSTLVYELSNKEFEQKNTINGVVKGIAPYNEDRVLYTQTISYINSSIKQSTPSKLIYKDGGYVAGEELKAYKFKNIFGFNVGFFKDDETKNVIFTQASGRLRLQFEKGSSYLNSPSSVDFASSANRISYNGQIYKIFCSLALFNTENAGTLVAGIENQSKLGILSNTFGYYSTAKLIFLKWTGNVLESYSSADIGGYVVDIVQGSFGPYQKVIIVPFTTTAKRTVVSVYSAR